MFKIAIITCLNLFIFISFISFAHAKDTFVEVHSYNPDTLALYKSCKELSLGKINENSNQCRIVLKAALYSFSIAEMNIYGHMDDEHRRSLAEYFFSKPPEQNNWPCSSMYGKSQWNPMKPEQLYFIAKSYVSFIDQNKMLLTLDVNRSLYSVLFTAKQ